MKCESNKFLISRQILKKYKFQVSCWDIRSGNIVQEYDRHLNPVNTITFIDENKRFVTTSDDKSIRVWEWDIPVDFKYIADPGKNIIREILLSAIGPGFWFPLSDS